MQTPLDSYGIKYPNFILVFVERQLGLAFFSAPALIGALFYFTSFFKRGVLSMNIVLPFLLSIVIFPFIWVFYCFVKIVWGAILAPIFEIFLRSLLAILSVFEPRVFLMNLLTFFKLLLTLPITLIIGIPLGLVTSFISAAETCSKCLEGIFGED